jgi:hypothetical protein
LSQHSSEATINQLTRMKGGYYNSTGQPGVRSRRLYHFH